MARLDGMSPSDRSVIAEGGRALRSIWFLAAIAFNSEAAFAKPGPLPAPARYATGNYGLTFPVPHGVTYCPLPRNWVGSDHGTTLFIERPRRCGGVGFPSSSRGFEPETVSRISVFYAYWLGDDEPPPSPCHHVGTVRFLGQARPICETHDRGRVVREVRGRYVADIEAEAVLTLVTRPGRLEHDMAAFRLVAQGMRACNGGWRDAKGVALGKGPACPKGVRWF